MPTPKPPPPTPGQGRTWFANVPDAWRTQHGGCCALCRPIGKPPSKLTVRLARRQRPLEVVASFGSSRRVHVDRGGAVPVGRLGNEGQHSHHLPTSLPLRVTETNLPGWLSATPVSVVGRAPARRCLPSSPAPAESRTPPSPLPARQSAAPPSCARHRFASDVVPSSGTAKPNNTEDGVFLHCVASRTSSAASSCRSSTLHGRLGGRRRCLPMATRCAISGIRRTDGLALLSPGREFPRAIASRAPVSAASTSPPTSRGSPWSSSLPSGELFFSRVAETHAADFRRQIQDP